MCVTSVQKVFVEITGGGDKGMDIWVLNPIALEISKDQALQDASWVGEVGRYVQVQIHWFHESTGSDWAIEFQLDSQIHEVNCVGCGFHFPLGDAETHDGCRFLGKAVDVEALWKKSRIPDLDGVID